MDLLVITPSRGRPERLAEMVDAVRATRHLDTRVIACVDDDDPTSDAYADVAAARAGDLLAIRAPRRSLAGWTNYVAKDGLDGWGKPRYLASLGDDHIPRTPGWDEQLVKAIEAMDGPGWAYGNDLFQGERIPTAWVQSTELVRALRWMMLPTCEHLCVDSAVRDLGHASGRLAYLPDVVIEHMHPAAGKAAEDDTYRGGNSAERNEIDSAAYRRWGVNGLDRDAATVRALTWPTERRVGRSEDGRILPPTEPLRRLQDTINASLLRQRLNEAGPADYFG